MSATPEQRAAYLKGLRALADVLEQHDEIPLPHVGRTTAITIWFTIGSSDPRSEMAAAAKAIPCTWHKNAWESSEQAFFELQGTLHGLSIDLTAYRDAVCERIVTGIETVTERVKDPEALAAVPEVEVTRQVPTVEWRCHPLLAPAGQPEGEAQ